MCFKKTKINSEEVHKMFMDCLFKKDEIDKDNNPIPEKVIIEGLTSIFYLHKERLENYRAVIENYIKQLPVEFIEGWSFLNLCIDRNGNQWTSMHRICEEFLIMSIGLNLACYCTNDRDIWRILPGGVPYIQFEDI